MRLHLLVRDSLELEEFFGPGIQIDLVLNRSFDEGALGQADRLVLERDFRSSSGSLRMIRLEQALGVKNVFRIPRQRLLLLNQEVRDPVGPIPVVRSPAMVYLHPLPVMNR